MYQLFAKHLPLPNAKPNLWQKELRYLLTKGTIIDIGLNVNIEKGATFTENLTIGDNSGWYRS